MNNDEFFNLPLDPLLPDLFFDSELRGIAVGAYKRLKTDNEMKNVIEKFQRKGIKEHNIEWLLSTLPSIYGEWEAIKNESLKERRKRHEVLASKLLEIVKELDTNDDTKYFTICDAKILRETYNLIPETKDMMEKGLLTPEAILPGYPVPTLSQYLSGFSKMLEQGDLIPEFDEELFEKLPYKRSIRSYAIKRIQELITNMFEQSGQNLLRQYNKDIAILANTLLNLKEKPVTANDVTQVLKETRRKYWID